MDTSVARRRRCHDQSGMVTAEAAMVLPLIALFALALLWTLAVGIAKIETVDAARDAARMIARGDDDAAALAAARAAAPAGAQVRIEQAPAGSVTVVVTVDASAPGWLLMPLPGVTVGGTATTPLEVPSAGQK